VVTELNAVTNCFANYEFAFHHVTGKLQLKHLFARLVQVKPVLCKGVEAVKNSSFWCSGRHLIDEQTSGSPSQRMP
jgi:hypothetical protein